MNLKEKVIKGGFWSFFCFYGLKIFSLVYTIIIARLLMPEDFGLASLVGVVTSSLLVFSETGVDRALIQRKEINNDFLNTAWVINIIRYSLLFLVIYSLSPLMAKFFNNENLSPLLKVASFTLLFTGFNNIGLVLFEKELLFKTRAIYDFITSLFKITLTIILAFMLRNVWAIILGLLIGSIFNLIISFVIHPYRPKFTFNKKVATELFNFGKYIFLGEILIFILYQGDDALVGKVLGASALGFYALAYGISNKPTYDISNIIGKITFPAYSKLQDNISSLRNYYHKTLKLTSILTFAYGTILLVFSFEIIKFVFGEKWLPMLNALRVLCIYGILRSLFVPAGALFLSQNRPDLYFRTNFWTLILMVIIIYPLTVKFEILGTAIATTLSILVKTGLCFYYANVILKERVSYYFKDISLPFFISIFLGILFWSIKDGLVSILFLLIFISTFAIIFFLLLFIFDRILWRELKQIAGLLPLFKGG